MAKNFETWLHSPAKFMLLLLAFNLMFFVIGWASCLNRETWPSWIQGVGSVEAILVAVWVAWHQSKMQADAAEKNANAELAALLRSFRAEVQFHLENYTRIAGEAIESSAEGEQLRFTVPGGGHNFVTFAALTPRLGAIVEVDVRKQILTAYMTLNSFIELLRYNNDLVRRMREALDDGEVANPQTMKALTNCGNSIRGSWEKTKRELRGAIDVLSNV